GGGRKRSRGLQSVGRRKNDAGVRGLFVSGYYGPTNLESRGNVAAYRRTRVAFRQGHCAARFQRPRIRNGARARGTQPAPASQRPPKGGAENTPVGSRRNFSLTSEPFFQHSSLVMCSRALAREP